MARRRPGQVRTAPSRGLRPEPGRKTVSGVSARTQREIAVFEDAHAWPGAVADAMARWTGTVHGPARGLTDPSLGGCGVEACCPSEAHPREMLEQALRGLRTEASRELRRRVRPLDELYCSRTIVDSYGDPSQPWWIRRC
ncbi:hypothetical protein OH807_11280 [Kitasatospora sp. NBC_01560]|uniref:hypothetical protein n=1 Tax=Kitasatospora sp. NBC_01560 TaxID=2975965 RepID=UPI00386851F5